MTFARLFARCIVAVALAGAAAQPSHAQEAGNGFTGDFHGATSGRT